MPNMSDLFSISIVFWQLTLLLNTFFLDRVAHSQLNAYKHSFGGHISPLTTIISLKPTHQMYYVHTRYICTTYVYMSHMTVLPEVTGSEEDNWVTLEKELCCLLSVGFGLLITNVWSCEFGTPIWSDFDLEWPKAFLTLGAKVVLPTVVSCGWAL